VVGIAGNWRGEGDRKLTALTLCRVFLVIKVDTRKETVLNSEEVRVIGNN
jgi:hypothetical protein